MQSDISSLKGIFKSLIILAIPIVCQNFITYGVTLADNLMVGRLGEAAINGLFMAAIVQFVLHMLLCGIHSPMAVLIAQYWGRRDTESIKRLVAISLRGAIILSLAVAIATFVFPHQII